VTTHDLSQADTRRLFETQGDGPWTIVSNSVYSGGGGVGMYCALADPARREEALSMDASTRPAGAEGSSSRGTTESQLSPTSPTA